MFIKKFESFKSDKPDKSYNVYLSNDLLLLLSSMKDPISDKLINFNGQSIKKDIGFIDIERDKLILCHVPNKKIIKRLKDHHGFTDEQVESYFYSEIDSLFNKVFTKIAKQDLRIGKFVKELLPDASDKEVESFVNSFKSAISKTDEIEMVEGDSISFWYNYKNYYSSNGPLYNSCMKSKIAEVFEIYTKNPDVCRMVIITKYGKLIARALVWKIEENNKNLDFEYFMDRRYYSEDYLDNTLKNYAIEQGWAYKTFNRHDSTSRVTWQDTDYDLEMTVSIGGSYKMYPYMDTFKRLVISGTMSYLYNHYDDGDEDQSGDYILDQTDGTWRELEVDDEDYVYSEYLDRRILNDDSVWSEVVDSYLLEDDSVYVNGEWYPDDHEDIVCINSVWYHIDDTVYSGLYDESLPAEKAIPTIVDLEDSLGNVDSFDDTWGSTSDRRIIPFSEIENYNWFKFMLKERENWKEYTAIHRDLLALDSDGEWILNIMAIEVIGLKNTYKGINSMRPIDAYVLDLQTEGDVFTSNIYDYTEDILNIEDEISDAIRSMLKDEDTNYLYSKYQLEKRLEEIDNNYWK